MATLLALPEQTRLYFDLGTTDTHRPLSFVVSQSGHTLMVSLDFKSNLTPAMFDII